MTWTGTLRTPRPDARTAIRPRLTLLGWVSALYLLTPLVIFAVGWLRPVPGLVVLAGGVGGMFAVGPPGRPGPRWVSGLVIGAAVAAAWVYASGIVDDTTLPTFDWAKHTALLGDLVRSPWPATVELDGVGHYVRYYVAWYLPPALAAKSAGVENVLWISGVWSALGFTLVVAQVVDRFPRMWSRIAAALGFVAFSGLDVAGAAFTTWWSGESRFQDWAHLEVWTGGVYKLESNTTQALWVQQHAIGGWLGALLVLEALRARRPAVLVLAVFSTMLWSPFVALGLAPFALVGLLREVSRDHGLLRAPTFVMPVIAMTTAALVVALYLSAEPGGIPRQAMWTESQSPAFPFAYLLFLLLEVVILFALAAWLVHDVGWVQWTALGVLAIVPALIYGEFNDFGRRVSIPSLFVLCLMVLTAAFHESARRGRRFIRPARCALWGAMLIAAVTPTVEFVSRFRFADRYRTPVECSLTDDVCSGIGPDLKVQYLAPVEDDRLHRLLREPARSRPIRR